MKVANRPTANRKPVFHRVSAAAALGVALLSVSACGYIAPQETTHIANVTDGITTHVGDIQYNNLLIVSTGKDQPGRVLGTIENNTDSDATLRLKAKGGASAQVSVPANGAAKLENQSEAVTFNAVPVPPGGLELVTLGDGSGNTEDYKVPVLDGTLKEYRQYLPSSAATPSSTANPSSTGMASQGATPEPSESHIP